MQTCLLTLDSTSVAGQEASLLQLGALLRVVLVQGAGDSQTHRTSLAGRAAAGQGCLDVELVLALQQDQRVLDELLVELVREVVLQCAAVAGDLAGALNHADADDGALTATNGLDRALVQRSSRCGLFGLLALNVEGVTDGCHELLVGSVGGGVLCGLVLEGLGVVEVLSHYCATCLIS